MIRPLLLSLALWGCSTERSSSPSIDSLRDRSDSALCLLEEALAAPAGSSPVDTASLILPLREEKVILTWRPVDTITILIRDTVYIEK